MSHPKTLRDLRDLRDLRRGGRLVGVSPEMERTRMRVTLFCCWLDCDSSLAGASFVMRVCKDGSDLQGGDSDNHTIKGQQRTTTRAASKHETVEKTKKEEEGGGAFSACPWIPQTITFHSVVTKAEKKQEVTVTVTPAVVRLQRQQV